MSKDNGGSAFPQANHDAYGMGPGMIDDTSTFDVSGMTLRDYFAAKASQGMHANPACDSWGSEEMARKAYEWADAMLAERAK